MVTSIQNLTVDKAPILGAMLARESSFFVLCVGFTPEQADAFTVAYRTEFSNNWLSLQRAARHVDSSVLAYVDDSVLDSLLPELDYLPTTIVLATGVSYTPDRKRYIRKGCIPLVRLTETPITVTNLDADDYYAGVCATLLNTEIGDPDVVCSTLDYALLVSIRLNEDVIRRNTKSDEKAKLPLEAPDSVFESKGAGSDSGTDLPRVTVPPTASAALFKHVESATPVTPPAPVAMPTSSWTNLIPPVVFLALTSILISGCL